MEDRSFRQTDNLGEGHPDGRSHAQGKSDENHRGLRDLSSITALNAASWTSSVKSGSSNKRWIGKRADRSPMALKAVTTSNWTVSSQSSSCAINGRTERGSLIK